MNADIQKGTAASAITGKALATPFRLLSFYLVCLNGLGIEHWYCKPTCFHTMTEVGIKHRRSSCRRSV
jgi:hypothetical protein